MKHIKLFEDFKINEAHKSTEDMSFKEIKELKDKMRSSGDYRNYIGKAEKVTNFLRNLSSQSSPWVERDSPSQVKVFNTPDEDSKHEIEDIAGEFGLNPIDLNSDAYTVTSGNREIILTKNETH